MRHGLTIRAGAVQIRTKIFRRYIQNRTTRTRAGRPTPFSTGSNGAPNTANGAGPMCRSQGALDESSIVQLMT